jgi:hypothetical protein
MRAHWSALVLTIALLLPNVGKAQVYQFATPPPDVSAGGAEWQISGEPVVVGGLEYYATRAFRLFDGQVMAQTGLYENVPVYSDTTAEPFSEIYVPVGNGRMRVYERRREGELAGTTGSHLPTFPVESPSAPPMPERVVGTSGTSEGARVLQRETTDASAAPARPRHTLIVTGVPLSGAPNGVWLEFRGTRWYSSGPATTFSNDRFEQIGSYRGFPVYRDRTSSADRVWVAVVKDGPLAPYSKKP